MGKGQHAIEADPDPMKWLCHFILSVKFYSVGKFFQKQ